MAKSSIDFKAVILAGGSGERFWPLSTPERPKQFLRVFGGESLLRQSVARLRGAVRPRDVYVVTSRDLVAATRRELPELPAANILGEPERRDTGAAVALGVGAASRNARDCTIGVFPSDQMVGDAKAFRRTVLAAAKRASEGSEIVTFGIRPAYPSTGFGYVDPRTGRFVEKPGARRARDCVKKGFLWNAGMFIARAATFRRAFVAHATALSVLCELDGFAPQRIAGVYAGLPRVSFDCAVMEKYAHVAVLPGDFGWDDVGSFAAFDAYFPHDRAGNVREGPCNAVESRDCICVARAARISLLGVNNLVVVTTPDAVLVADKARIAEMKKLFRR